MVGGDQSAIIAAMDPLDELRARVVAHVRAQAHEAVELKALDRLPGGACQENFKLELTLAGKDRRFAVRADAPSSLPGSINRAAEFPVINAAVAAGVKTPQAHWLAPDLLRSGSTAYFLDWVEGEAVGRRVVSSPKLEQARAGLAAACAHEMARIHTITPQTHPTLFTSAPPADPVTATLADLRRQVDALPEPRPALELALRWMEDHPPVDREVTLVHGDFRTGNLMVSPRGLEALLDWEFAHWGSPLEDLSWLCVRDWRFGKLDQPVGGFAQRGAFYAAYERESGRQLRREDLLFWEVVGNVRWAIGSLYQGERYLSGAQDDLELIAIARRAIEMEYEALRLIERGL
jgi:aminoglycoside phosphotransferase (APT) family kinase protein